jgi:phytoene desaturase
MDWQQQESIYKGSTFSLSHKFSQMLYWRPHNRFEEFENCYLVGSGTHPGSGLPTIYESARISSDLICQKYRVSLCKGTARSMAEKISRGDNDKLCFNLTV